MKLRAILYAIIISVLPLAAAECSTLEQVKTDAKTLNPPVIVTEMGEKETQAFLNIYNALPPITDRRGDYSVVLSRPTSINVVYMYFKEKCVVATLYMSRKFFQEILLFANPKAQGQKA